MARRSDGVTNLPAPSLLAIRAGLLRYYRRAARDLPWRRTRDPYAIWVSEIMLQQTQVDTVLPRYGRFLAQFPCVAALAAAPETAVCEAWAGLGYYRRARLLHAAARMVCEKYGGELPASAAAWRELPGIGRYTAGAIASIAFGEAAPIVDGNVARVLSRLFGLQDPPGSSSGQRQLWALAAALVVGSAPGDLNQAAMELGALVCTPTRPNCDVCPVKSHCVARARGDQERLPRPDKRPVRRALCVAFAWIETPGAGVWLERRSLEGLWAGLWQLPGCEGVGAKRHLQQRLGVRLGRRLARIEHALTHRQVTASVYACSLPPAWAATPERRPFADPRAAALSALARKAIVAVSDIRQTRRVA